MLNQSCGAFIVTKMLSQTGHLDDTFVSPLDGLICTVKSVCCGHPTVVVNRKGLTMILL